MQTKAAVNTTMENSFFLIIAFTETVKLSDATSRAKHQAHIDFRRCDSK